MIKAEGPWHADVRKSATACASGSLLTTPPAADSISATTTAAYIALATDCVSADDRLG
jgi:hypothetical protein